jgi:hypothetical protein
MSRYFLISEPKDLVAAVEYLLQQATADAEETISDLESTINELEMKLGGEQDAQKSADVGS